jgi:hypothetical protein
MIPEVDIWRAATLMLRRYGDKALDESTTRADHLVVSESTSSAIWRAMPPRSSTGNRRFR